jgi:hypothetical protein
LGLLNELPAMGSQANVTGPQAKNAGIPITAAAAILAAAGK